MKTSRKTRRGLIVSALLFLTILLLTSAVHWISSGEESSFTEPSATAQRAPTPQPLQKEQLPAADLHYTEGWGNQDGEAWMAMYEGWINSLEERAAQRRAANRLEGAEFLPGSAEALASPQLALFEAIAKADVEEVREALANGARVRDAEGFSNTPLGRVVAGAEGQANLAIVRELLYNGADPMQMNRWGDTAISEAMVYMTESEYSFEVLRMLVEAGGTLYSMNERGESPIDRLLELRQGNPEECQEVLETISKIATLTPIPWELANYHSRKILHQCGIHNF